MSDLNYVGCDDGYASIKMAFFDAERRLQQMSFPSKVASGVHAKSFDNRPTNEVYRTNSNPYTVSAATASTETRTDKWPLSEMNRVLVHHGLRLAGMSGKKVVLSTGLPPGDYYKDGHAGKNDRFSLEKAASVKMPVEIENGDFPPAEVVTSFVMPEGVVAALDHMTDFNGQIINQYDGKWAVVDIGGRTTDVVTLIPSGDNVGLYDAGTGSLNSGVLNVLDEIASRLVENKQSEDKNISGLSHALERNYVTIWGNRVDISDVKEAAIKQIGVNLLTYIDHMLEGGSQMMRILLVGGGAHVFGPTLKAKYRNLVVADRPEFANARGLLKYGMFNS